MKLSRLFKLPWPPQFWCHCCGACVGPEFPDQALDIGSGGVAYAGLPGNVQADDNADITATFSNAQAGVLAEFLVWDFDLTVPSGATIDEINVTVEHWKTLNRSATMFMQMMVKVGGGAGYTNYAGSSQGGIQIPTTRTATTFSLPVGVIVDTDVNSSNFGVRINVKPDTVGVGNTQVLHIDYVTLEVCYS